MSENKEIFAISHDLTLMSKGFDQDVSKASNSSRVKIDTQKILKDKSIIPWGENNLFLEDLMQEAAKSTIIPSTQEKIAAAIYGGGVVAGKLTWDEKGKETFKPILDESKEGIIIREFFRRSNIDTYAYEAALNYVWSRNIRPHISLNNDEPGNRSITSISNENSSKVRWGAPKGNKWNTGVSEAFLHGKWADISEANPAIPVPVIEEGFDTATTIKNFKENTFILKLKIPGILGSEYYPTPNWYGAKLSKWLDVSLKIPKYKSYLMDNQMSIKYLIYIDLSYWSARYPDWEKKTLQEKKLLRSEVLSEFIKELKGTEKGGSAVMADMKIGPNGATQKLWEIEEIGKKSKNDNQYIEDSQEASSHIMWALGADPSVLGTGPGKGLSSGGGGDKRVGANLEVSKLRFVQNLILKPLEYWRDTNDSIPEWVVFRFRNTIQLTLDQGKSQQETG